MWSVEFAAEAESDFALIFDHHLWLYQDFGDDFDIAFDHADQRIRAIQSTAQDLANVPFQETLRPDILEGLRFVRRNKAVFWFVSNESLKTIQVLAILFGGQNHIHHMLTRLLSDLSE